MTQDTIERLALGNPISLGYLYNACKEKTCNVSILKQYPPPSECVIITDMPNTNSDFIHEKSISDKFSRLDVAAELKLSLCAGLVNVKGSGEYFKETKNSERSVSVSLFHKITTKHENMSILDERLKEFINLDALRHHGATHVVTGVTWGANLVVTVEYKNSERMDEQKIAGGFQAELKKYSINLEGSASVGYGDGDNKAKSNFTLKIVGDVVASGRFPTTIEDAMNLLAELPSLLQTYNDGKGVPIRYEMISLEAIQSYFGFNIQIDGVLRSIEEETILRMVTLFDSINAAKQKMNDLCADVDKYEDHLPQSMRSEVKQLRDEAAVAESKFKTKLRNLLIQVRSCEAEESDLDNVKIEYESGPYSSIKVLRKLQNDYRALKAKIGQVSNLQNSGVIIVPSHTESLSNKLLEIRGKEVYVLYGESQAIAQDRKLWQLHLAKFRSLTDHPKTSGIYGFMYVDLDAAEHLQPETEDGELRKILLQRFNEHGECVECDVLSTNMMPMAAAVQVEKDTPQIGWMSAADGDVPKNAVEGGWEVGEILYVARASHKGEKRIGKLQQSHRGCYVECDCYEIKVAKYEVLVAPPGTFRWIPSKKGEKVDNAVIGGKTENGEPYFIGRCRHRDAIIPGKVLRTDEVCYITYDCSRTWYKEYEVLVSTTNNFTEPTVIE